MCFSNDPPPPPPPPAAPPPPPPVLEQAAPETGSPTAGEDAQNQAQGVKKYRTTSLGIPSTGSTGSTNSGLGISM